MITIALNDLEKCKLIEILLRDNSLEASEIIARINTAHSFLMPMQSENTFNFYNRKRVKYIPVPPDSSNNYSGMKFECEQQ